jgi:hypothetical protein
MSFVAAILGTFVSAACVLTAVVYVLCCLVLIVDEVQAFIQRRRGGVR